MLGPKPGLRGAAANPGYGIKKPRHEGGVGDALKRAAPALSRREQILAVACLGWCVGNGAAARNALIRWQRSALLNLADEQVEGALGMGLDQL